MDVSKIARTMRAATLAVLASAYWCQPVQAGDGIRIELSEIVPAKTFEPGMTVEDGKIAFALPFGQFEFLWTPIPKSFGPEGFHVTLTVHGRINDSSGERPLPIATTVSGTGFTTDPGLAEAKIVIGRGQDLTQSQEVIVKPDPSLKDGDVFEISVGASIGPITTYRFRVGAGAAGAYLGCFKDPNNPFDLDGYLERSPQNTPQRCIDICAARGFMFAGVQYGESCLCGQNYNRFGTADNCTMACTGDPAQICGGENANSVYATGR